MITLRQVSSVAPSADPADGAQQPSMVMLKALKNHNTLSSSYSTDNLQRK